MKRYFKIRIASKSSEEAEIILADLSDIGFYAFEEENEALDAYINEADFDEETLKEILPSNTTFSKNIIEEKNWNALWEKAIEPVIVGNFVAVRPSFSKPINNVKFDLLITPKMSFGTGHHATTFLMIQLMEGLVFKNKTVVDFGTGTGVLAILAEKCGAAEVTAIDDDEWSIKNATENIEANNCKKIFLRQQSNLLDIAPADIVLCNINLNVLKSNSKAIKALLKPASFLLVSGFLQKDESAIEAVFAEKGIVKESSGLRAGWLAILFKHL